MQRAIAAPMFPRPINAAFIFAPCSRRESHIYDSPTPKNSIDDNSHSYFPMRPIAAPQGSGLCGLCFGMTQLQQGFAADGMGFRFKLHGNNFKPPMSALGQK